MPRRIKAPQGGSKVSKLSKPLSASLPPEGPKLCTPRGGLGSLDSLHCLGLRLDHPLSKL